MRRKLSLENETALKICQRSKGIGKCKDKLYQYLIEHNPMCMGLRGTFGLYRN